jgi:hypothetical protein
LPDKKKCFVIAPIGDENTFTRRRSDQILNSVIKPAVESFNYEVIRSDTIAMPGVITSQIIEYLMTSDLVIADLTGANPNVTYELALRHAFRKHVIQIKDSGIWAPLPFDIQGIRTIEVEYNFVESMDKCKNKIMEQIRNIELNPEKVESPVSVALDYESLKSDDNPQSRLITDLVSRVDALTSKVDKIEWQNNRPKLVSGISGIEIPRDNFVEFAKNYEFPSIVSPESQPIRRLKPDENKDEMHNDSGKRDQKDKIPKT